MLTNQCERPSEKEVVLRQWKEAIGPPANRELVCKSSIHAYNKYSLVLDCKSGTVACLFHLSIEYLNPIA